MNTEQEKEYTLDEIVAQTFDFSGYPESEHQQLISETSEMLMEASLMKALEESDESTQDAFNAFVETEPDQENLMGYILKTFPNFQSLLIAEIQALKNLGEKK